LFQDGGYDHRDALFGRPAYGGSIAQNVYYAQSTLCDQNVDTSTGVPAREIDPKTNKMQPWPSPYILMVDRGECSFVQKVSELLRLKNSFECACWIDFLTLPCVLLFRSATLSVRVPPEF
jgi:hypothetical protein